MKYDNNRLETVMLLIKDFLYHLASHRQIGNYLNKLPGDREFWVYTSNAHLANAALVWCMVFGTDSNQTHWKKIFTDNSQETEFLEYLKAKHNITHGAYAKYWESVKKFRNDFVAHKTNYSNPVPYFDMACKIAFDFGDWISTEIMPYDVGLPNFQELFCEHQKGISETLEAIIQ